MAEHRAADIRAEPLQPAAAHDLQPRLPLEQLRHHRNQPQRGRKVGVPVSDQRRFTLHGGRHSGAHRFGLASVALQRHHADLPRETLHQLLQHHSGPIPASVVDENQHQLRLFGEEGRNRRHIQPLLFIVTGNHDTDIRHTASNDNPGRWSPHAAGTSSSTASQ